MTCAVRTMRQVRAKVAPRTHRGYVLAQQRTAGKKQKLSQLECDLTACAQRKGSLVTTHSVTTRASELLRAASPLRFLRHQLEETLTPVGLRFQRGKPRGSGPGMPATASPPGTWQGRFPCSCRPSDTQGRKEHLGEGAFPRSLRLCCPLLDLPRWPGTVTWPPLGTCLARRCVP